MGQGGCHVAEMGLPVLPPVSNRKEMKGDLHSGRAWRSRATLERWM